MVLLYVKRKGEEAPRIEVTVERVEGMAVKDFRDAVAQKINLEKEELHLMYGGCVLKAGKTLDQYHIAEGCTLHVVQRRKKVRFAPLPIGPEGMTVVFSSPTIQKEIAPFISDPEKVTKMIPLGNLAAVQAILKDPDLLTKISDMARINHHIRKNYLLFPVMQALLKLHRIKFSVRDRGTSLEPLSVQVGQILQMASGGIASEVVGQPDSASDHLARAQEQTLGQSQATHPPNSQIHGTIHPDGSSAPPAGATLPSFSVTTADLASALASIGTEQSVSQSSSLQSSTLDLPSQESSQPSSLQLPHSYYSGSSAPASLQVSEDLDSTHHPPSVNRSLSDSGRGGMGTGHNTAVAPISRVDLQQALNLALSNIQQSSASAPTVVPQSHHAVSSASRHPAPPTQRALTVRELYLPHLEQLHAMGITYSDSECLHALEAAQGDLQMALEILMGPGN